MNPIHTSAKSSHYDDSAATYDAFNEQRSAIINTHVQNILKDSGAKTVLDMTCGTGSQVFWLTKCGFDVTGSDISTRMLEVARNKAMQNHLELAFIEGDMRNLHAGHFDAVITIFNAIGHLTKEDFAVAIRNIYRNLNAGGLYIFDINNLDFLLHDRNISSLTIDWLEKTDDKQCRYIQHSTINPSGILASYTTAIEDCNSENQSIKTSMQTLQIYTAQQLKEILEQNEFSVIKQCDIDGTPLNPTQTERILTVAKKNN